MNPPVRVVNITRKEKEYRGMLEYREGDESRLLKNVVTGMFDLFCSSKSFSELFLELFVMDRRHSVLVFCFEML